MSGEVMLCHVHVIYFSVDLFTRYGNSRINNTERSTAT
jgi:hypothetical protein